MQAESIREHFEELILPKWQRQTAGLSECECHYVASYLGMKLQVPT